MTPEERAEARAKYQADLAARIEAKDARIAEIRGNRHKPTDGTAAYLCNQCGGAHVARGYCTNCGSPATMKEASRATLAGMGRQ
jgi:ribosomal protein L37E